MCGRYTLSGLDRIPDFLEVDEVHIEPRFNIAPTQEVPAVRLTREGLRELDFYRWGLIPYWAKDEKIGARMINARSETVAGKSAFQRPFKQRRCLIPANGYFEWETRPDGKQPFLFRRKDRDLVAFAGLWERWRSPLGRIVRSCSILTTGANSLTAPIHDRMPVILPTEAHGLWLAHASAEEDLLSLLKPYPAGEMEAVAVSRSVNNVRCDGPECVAPVRDAPSEALHKPARRAGTGLLPFE